MRARIDISEVETRTKIRAKYLRAIENEEWDLLPGPVYVKSFLRTYGDYLGLDSRLLIDDYKRRYERPSDGELRPVSSLHRERERAARGPLLPSWAVIGGVLLLVVAALFVIGELSGGKPTPSNTTVARPAVRHRGVRRHRARARPVPPALASVRLAPTGTVYVCLVDGTGRKLINQQTFSAGQSVPVQRAPKLLLTLGNNSLVLRADGRPVPITASATAIRLLITPTGTRPIPLGAPPTCP